MTRSTSLCSTLACLSLSLAALACKPPQIADEGGTETGDGDGDPTGDGDGDPTGDGDGDPTGDGDGDDLPGCASALDILIILDNSGSMGEAQRRLALGASGLIDQLDAAGIDWRIGVTTSDNGNPWCPAGTTTPEGGKLVFSSCKTRLSDFLFANDVDVRDSACNDICELDSVTTAPTPTEVDPNAMPRPWIERIDGTTNLANGATVEQALPCILPQGINGCGFESQLESSYLALTRAQTNFESNYGFMRASASLLVLIVSDEVDCSYNKDWSEIFDQDGNKAFWSDPASAFPTSALCWNAGVECTGDPSGYDSCVAQNYDVNGSPTTDPSAAVLHPLSRYTEQLEAIENAKQNLDPSARVRVALLAGVPFGGEPSYAESTDPVFQDSFGIAPGCGEIDGPVVGLPPVRMRELSLDTGGLARSVCATEYEGLLAQIVEPFHAACN